MAAVLSHLTVLHQEETMFSACLYWFRGAPAGISALLCQEALSQLLQNDLSPFHCPQEPEANQEEEQHVLCKYMLLLGVLYTVYISTLTDLNIKQ